MASHSRKKPDGVAKILPNGVIFGCGLDECELKDLLGNDRAVQCFISLVSERNTPGVHHLADGKTIEFSPKNKGARMADEQWTSINLNGGNLADEGPSAVSVWISNPWKDLWLEWFSEEGDPLFEGKKMELYCFFCGEYFVKSNENGHDENCIYLRAKQLIESETAVITTTGATDASQFQPLC